jgi:helicase required for RNAi-mediated heterochromatin assembly 1
VNVVTVDSFQGEENEIVILSLVRSGRPTIGFLSIENRVCVALSRARTGFYMFGDSTALADADSLWWQVVTLMGGKNPKRRLGFYLPLTCTKHENVIYKKGSYFLRSL